MLVTVLLSLLLLQVDAQQNYTKENPCRADLKDLAKLSQCREAGHIAVPAGRVEFGTRTNVDKFMDYFGKKMTMRASSPGQATTLEIAAKIRHLTFPSLQWSTIDLEVVNNSHVESINLPQLDYLGYPGGLTIQNNPNLLEVNINGNALLRKLVVGWNDKLREDQLDKLRKVLVMRPDHASDYSIQSEGDCYCETRVMKSLKELKGCKRIRGSLVFPANVMNVDYPLGVVEVAGTVRAERTGLRTLSFLRTAGNWRNVKSVIRNNEYLCDADLHVKFKNVSGNCPFGCSISRSQVPLFACRAICEAVTVNRTNEGIFLRQIEDFRSGVKIIGTSLTTLDGILAAASRIYTKERIALDIRKNANLTDLSALSSLTVLRSRGRVKVRIVGNRAKMTEKEKLAFLKRTGLGEEEVLIETAPPRTRTTSAAAGTKGGTLGARSTTGQTRSRASRLTSAATPQPLLSDEYEEEPPPSRGEHRRAASKDEEADEGMSSDSIVGVAGITLMGLIALGIIVFFLTKHLKKRREQAARDRLTAASTSRATTPEEATPNVARDEGTELKKK